MADVYQFLADNQIEYERHDHPPVFTVADVERLVPTLPAVKTKNLFLRDKKGRRHFLVAVPAQKRVNIKATVLATINDPGHAVELIFDTVLWEEETFQFHPLVNTSTLVISRENLKRFFELTGHEVRLLDVPSQA
jgi:Ala-tRNA(Pro) deacylase